VRKKSLVRADNYIAEAKYIHLILTDTHEGDFPFIEKIEEYKHNREIRVQDLL